MMGFGTLGNVPHVGLNPEQLRHFELRPCAARVNRRKRSQRSEAAPLCPYRHVTCPQRPGPFRQPPSCQPKRLSENAPRTPEFCLEKSRGCGGWPPHPRRIPPETIPHDTDCDKRGSPAGPPVFRNEDDRGNRETTSVIFVVSCSFHCWLLDRVASWTHLSSTSKRGSCF